MEVTIACSADKANYCLAFSNHLVITVVHVTILPIQYNTIIQYYFTIP